jgi:hypothetical protein
LDVARALTRRSLLRTAGSGALAVSAFSALPALAGANPAVPSTELTAERRATFAALVGVVADDPGLAVPAGGPAAVVEDFATRYSAAAAEERAGMNPILDFFTGQGGPTPFSRCSSADQVAQLRRNLQTRGGAASNPDPAGLTRMALTIAARPFCPGSCQVPPLLILAEA